MKDHLKIKINTRFGKFIPGTIINVRHNNGIPLDKYWRDRVRDSQVDNCVTVIQPAEKKQPAKEKINKEV